MELWRWMQTNKVPIVHMARELGVATESVYGWMTGQHAPSKRHQRRIHTFTGGEVTQRDLRKSTFVRAVPLAQLVDPDAPRLPPPAVKPPTEKTQRRAAKRRERTDLERMKDALQNYKDRKAQKGMDSNS